LSDVEVTLTWNPNIGEIVDSAIAFGLNNAGVHLQGAIKRNFGTQGEYGARQLVNYVTGKRGGKKGRNVDRPSQLVPARPRPARSPGSERIACVGPSA